MNLKRIIDLSMPVKDHFRWKIERRQNGSFAAGDQFQTTWIGTGCHGFTHMDSQRHIMADGFTTDAIALNQVVGECAVVDLSGIAEGAPVERDAVEQVGGHVRKGDIVLMKTAWDTRYSPETPEFWTKAPYLTRGAAEWLREREVKAVAFDFPQDYPIRLLLTGEVAPLAEYVSHDVLLRNGIILIEYLCNTSELTKPRTFLCALPLKVPESDGAPSRVIALEE